MHTQFGRQGGVSEPFVSIVPVEDTIKPVPWSMRWRRATELPLVVIPDAVKDIHLVIGEDLLHDSEAFPVCAPNR